MRRGAEVLSQVSSVSLYLFRLAGVVWMVGEDGFGVGCFEVVVVVVGRG